MFGGEVLDADADELGAAKAEREAEQQQRAVTRPPGVAGSMRSAVSPGGRPSGRPLKLMTLSTDLGNRRCLRRDRSCPDRGLAEGPQRPPAPERQDR